MSAATQAAAARMALHQEAVYTVNEYDFDWSWGCKCGHSFGKLSGTPVAPGIPVVDFRMAEHQLAIAAEIFTERNFA